MHAKLMGAAGQRLQLDPRRAVARALDDPVARLRGQPLIVDVHLLAARPGLLGKRQVDLALRDVGHADDDRPIGLARAAIRSEEHTSELQSLMSISYAVFCLKKNTRY